jgi:amidase
VITDELRWWSANRTAAAIRTGALTAREVLEAAIARIERIDPHLNTVVIPLFERALEAAGAGFRAPDSAIPMFRGVPMLLKDAGEELAGSSHWVGTRGLRRADHLSSMTTELAVRFEALGFGIVGKSACPELSADSTTEPVGFAPTRNPWDTTRTVGGSSGGAAAAVAAGLVPLAHGSDATGSLRFPAAHCGVVTLKPSRGRIPIVLPTGQADPLRAWTQFALARDVSDLCALFPLLATGDSSPRPSRSLRVGLLDHDPILGSPVAPDCSAAVHTLGAALSLMGHGVEIGFPKAFATMIGPLWKSMRVVMPTVRSEQVAWMSSRLGRDCRPGDVTDEVLALAERAADFTPDQVRMAWDDIRTLIAGVADWWNTGFDLLVTPVMLEPPWRLGEEAASRTGMFCLPFSFTGQPALVVPVAMTADGLPVGVQIVGRVGDDELLLDLGAQLQEAIGWLDRRPPDFS